MKVFTNGTLIQVLEVAIYKQTEIHVQTQGVMWSWGCLVSNWKKEKPGYHCYSVNMCLCKYQYIYWNANCLDINIHLAKAHQTAKLRTLNFSLWQWSERHWLLPCLCLFKVSTGLLSVSSTCMITRWIWSCIWWINFEYFIILKSIICILVYSWSNWI